MPGTWGGILRPELPTTWTIRSNIGQKEVNQGFGLRLLLENRGRFWATRVFHDPGRLRGQGKK